MRATAALRGSLAAAAALLLLGACSTADEPVGLLDASAASATASATATPDPSPTPAPAVATLPADAVTDIAGKVAYTHPTGWVDGPESSGSNYVRHEWNTEEGTYVEVTGFSGQPTVDPTETSQAYVDATFGSASTVTRDAVTDVDPTQDAREASVSRFVVDYNDGGPVDVFCVGAVEGKGFGFLYVESSSDEDFLCNVAAAVLATVERG